ncbi:unnamed protein product [Vicia faba]|uniref:Uncharacterized protein n=1 Tax=Vicia faba TaxID=3906 RepID=A0AAV1AIJ1_VICFA|nr:unnamed protein product [Vicia faba]
MATNIVQEEEETLSLSDLPLPLNNPSKENHSEINETQEEFNFRSWVGLFSTEPEMCVADEVFFQGQILPSSRLSFSSEAGLSSNDHAKQLKSKQESLSFTDGCFNEFRSNSSTSQNSTTSSTTSSTTTTTRTNPIVSISKTPKTKVRNQFHTHPSPKPQLKSSTCPRKSTTQSRKSSVWEIFRLGVVPTPEIGLQDLKVRSSNHRNSVSCNSSSSSNSNSTKSVKMSKKKNDNGGKSNHALKHLVGKRGGLLSGCDCSFETVVINGSGVKSDYKTESTMKHAVKEKVMEWKKQKQRQKQGKKVMSRRRTFEWLKELHANHLDEEALLSNST